MGPRASVLRLLYLYFFQENIKGTVSAPEECFWCSFGLSYSSGLKIVCGENSTYCKEYTKERLASGIRT